MTTKKRPRGRPTKPATLKRTRVIKANVTADEDAAIRPRASEHGLTVSSWLLRQAIHAPPAKLPTMGL